MEKGDRLGREGWWRATNISRVLRAGHDPFFVAPMAS